MGWQSFLSLPAGTPVLIIMLISFLSMQPTKVKDFIDRTLAASSHDLPRVLEGFKWVYEKVRNPQTGL